jgi:hypothetical protein
MKKRAISQIIMAGVILILNFIFISPAKAQPLDTITLNYPGIPAPIFFEPNWSGEPVTKQITINNSYKSDKDLGIQISDITGDQELAQYLILDIIGSAIGFSSNLSNLISGEVYIAILPPGDTNLSLTIKLDPTIPNNMQNKKITFDMKFGFIARISPFPPADGGTTTTIPGGEQLITTITTGIKRLGAAVTIGGAVTTTTTIVAPTTTTTKIEEGVKGAENMFSGWSWCQWPWWIWLIILILIILLHLYLWSRRRRKNQE